MSYHYQVTTSSAIKKDPYNRVFIMVQLYLTSDPAYVVNSHFYPTLQDAIESEKGYKLFVNNMTQLHYDNQYFGNFITI